MGEVVSLRNNIRYKNHVIYFNKQEDGTISFHVVVNMSLSLSGIGKDITEAIRKARETVDKNDK